MLLFNRNLVSSRISRWCLSSGTPLLLLALSTAGCAQGSLPADAKIDGQVEKTTDWVTATSAATVTLPLPAVQDVVRIRGKSGAEKAGLRVTLTDAKGKAATLNVGVQELRIYWGKQKGKSLADANLRVSWPGGSGGLFVRPNMAIYNEEKREELSGKWDTLPPASQHPFSLELRRSGGVAQVWLDGQFLGELPVESIWTTCRVALSPGAALAGVQAEKQQGSPGRLPLPIAAASQTGGMENPQVQLAPAVALPDGLHVAKAPLAIAGLGRIPAVSIDLESHFWRHSAFDALPEARLFSVPQATYSYITLLCAAEDDPAKAPSFVVRLTRYGRNRGDAMADTTVTLPAGNANGSAQAQRVGEVSYGTATRKTVPLWLVRVPLKTGQIQDLLYDDKQKNPLLSSHRYLEVELLDPLLNVEASDQFPPTMEPVDRVYIPGGATHYRWNLPRDPVTKGKTRPDDKESAVHLFGAVLEESPAALEVRANAPALAFYASDNPELQATVTARLAGSYTVQWEFADVDGKIAVSDKKTLTLAAGAKETVSVPVKVDNGWYATRFRLLDSSGQVQVEHPSAFVFLPPDTRKAGFESPFGTWWFHWAHGGEPNIEKVGPVMQRAGLRHTQLPESLPESITKKYGVSAWMVPWRDVNTKLPLAERLAAHEALIRKYQTLWPSVDSLKIWHESSYYKASFPTELWGQTPPPLDGASEKAWQDEITYLTALAKMVREKFPNFKLQYGNSGTSLFHIAELLRRKFPREYIDSIASEDLGQVLIPESPGLYAVQDSWYLRETARKLGYGDLPLTASYEWMGRRAPSAGLKDQAEWYVRDALHGLAYGFDTIALGTVHDAGGGYFHSIWGASGFTRRYPVMEPRPSYAAIATLTRVLDSAKFEREVPTDRLSLYVLEFKRGNEWIYALWTPRGQRQITLQFNGESRSALIDLYGREKTQTGRELVLTASTATQYVVSPVRLENVATGKPSFPGAAPSASAFVVEKLEKATALTLEKPARYASKGNSVPHLTPGEFTVREVVDEEMGACLELELKPQVQAWDFDNEYVFLKLNAPLTAPGPAGNAGVWIKGNGGWGIVQFMVQGEKGPFMASSGYYPSWSGQNAINFEGWNFLSYPLERDYRWTGKGTVTGLLITMPQKALHLTEAKPVPELKIRLKNVTLY